MLDVKLIINILIIAIAFSCFSCAFIQKTKGMFKSSKYISLYGFFVNMVGAVTFCCSFTDLSIWLTPWVGIASFVGADTLYKTFEGKMSSYSDIIAKKVEIIPRD